MSDTETTNSINNVKALRGQWGSNRGPKMSRADREARKVTKENLPPVVSDNVRGWKANR